MLFKLNGYKIFLKQEKRKKRKEIRKERKKEKEFAAEKLYKDMRESQKCDCVICGSGICQSCKHFQGVHKNSECLYQNCKCKKDFRVIVIPESSVVFSSLEEEIEQNKKASHSNRARAGVRKK